MVQSRRTHRTHYSQHTASNIPSDSRIISSRWQHGSHCNTCFFCWSLKGFQKVLSEIGNENPCKAELTWRRFPPVTLQTQEFIESNLACAVLPKRRTALSHSYQCYIYIATLIWRAVRVHPTQIPFSSFCCSSFVDRKSMVPVIVAV